MRYLVRRIEFGIAVARDFWGGFCGAIDGVFLGVLKHPPFCGGD